MGPLDQTDNRQINKRKEKNRFNNLCVHGNLQRNITQVGGLNLVTYILLQRVKKCGEEARQSKRGLKPLGEGVKCGKVTRNIR